MPRLRVFEPINTNTSERVVLVMDPDRGRASVVLAAGCGDEDLHLATTFNM